MDNFIRTGQPSNVYRGVPLSPDGISWGGRRISQLDFNMPNPFVHEGDKLTLEVCGDGLSPSFIEDMCAVGQAEVRRNSCWAFSWQISNMHGKTYMQKPRMSRTYITCSCYGPLGDRGPIFGWSNPHFTVYWKTTLLASNGWGLVLGSWKGRNKNHALLSWVIKPGTIKGVGSVWFLLWGSLCLTEASNS